MLVKLFRVFTLNYYLFLVLFWVVFIPVVFFCGAVEAVIECIEDNPRDRKSFEEYRKEARRIRK